MLIHIIDSEEAKNFFDACGVSIDSESAYNAVTLENKTTGKQLCIWAEADSSVAGGVSGLFIEE